MNRHIFHILLLFACTTSVSAQRVTDREKSDPYDARSYFMYGANYLSNNVYLGRKDTLIVPYLTPYLGYHFKNGLYAQGLVSFTSAGGTRPDVATIEAGYDGSSGNIDWGGSVYKYFYRSTSHNTRSNILGSASVYAQYCNDWIQPQIMVDLNLIKNNADFVTNLSVDHDFELASGRVHVVPAMAMNISTQHFYDEYFLNRLRQADKNLKLKKVVVDAGKYKPRDYEFSIKTTFRSDKWLFTAIPVYVIPVHPAVVNLPTGTVTESLSNSFYVELDICHR